VVFTPRNADSEDEEGKFYVWTEEEIRRVLPSEDAKAALSLFGVASRSNFNETGGSPSGRNILHFVRPLEEMASGLQVSIDLLVSKTARIRQALFEAREKRVRPARDEKVLTDWNGLMITALARVGRVLNERRYLAAAVRAANFVQERLRNSNGELFHRYAQGERAIEGFLDDYAFFAWGLIEIYQTSFEQEFKETAFATIEKMIELFWDKKEGGFYFTAWKGADCLPRQKQVYDGALPSGNSVALLDLLLASRISAESRFDDVAGCMSKIFAREIRESPAGHAFFLCAMDLEVGPTYNVTVVGNPRDEDVKTMLKALNDYYLPNVVLSVKPPERPGLGYEQIDGRATAYVCRDKACFAPTNKIDRMLELLEIRENVNE
jgi:uncharacterized protein YyaL (SSP411 family)